MGGEGEDDADDRAGDGAKEAFDGIAVEDDGECGGAEGEHDEAKDKPPGGGGSEDFLQASASCDWRQLTLFDLRGH